MMQEYWGLNRNPFVSGTVHQCFSESQEEAIARIDFLIREHRRLGLLVGPGGIGKSTLLYHAVRQHRRHGLPAAYLHPLGMNAEEFLAELNQQLELPRQPLSTVAVEWRRLTDHLLTHQFQQMETVIAIDDIDDAAADVLNVIARIVQWSPAGEGMFTVIAAVASDRLEWLPERLAELVDLPIELTQWEIEDTAEFVRREIAAAGGLKNVFDDAAIHTLHQLASGEPRQICRLADMALLAGAGQDAERIDAEIIHTVAEELGHPSTVLAVAESG